MKCWNCGRTLSNVEAVMWCTRCGLSARHEPVVEPSALDESLLDTHRALAALDTELKALAQRAEAIQEENERLRAESSEGCLSCAQSRLRLERVREALATFYRAPLSISSVQPLLDLACELNPGLKVTR